MNTDARRDPVEELAEEFARRLRQGERPCLSEYTARHPDLAAEIRDLFPALVVMEQFGSIAEPATPVTRAPAPPRLGDFRIVREVGRGGMGVVYEAVQESLGRHVALKVLPAGGTGGAGTSRERFRREARAAARLHHTNIVPVFAVGEDGATLYYAMQFIRGQGLDSVLAEVRRLRTADGRTSASAGRTSGIARRLLTGQFRLTGQSVTPRPEPSGGGPAATATTDAEAGGLSSMSGELAAQPEGRYCREVTRLGVQAAEALHYAHQQGILHRDVKPSNLLLDAAGTLWVTDFGLAKAADSDDLTGTGDLIGTLRYMAPERFTGRADPRSDVYSLAVTLYEMLTLRPAYDDTDRLRVIERIGRHDPPPVRAIAPDVPRDLETVIHKAAARVPSDRYASAQELADDLRRFLDGRPVRARRHRWSEQAWRWCRRNPAVAGLAGAVALLLAAVAVVSTAAAVRLGAALTEANDNLTRAVSAEVDADTNRWRSHLLDARASRLSRGPGQRFAALASLRQAVTVARARDMPADRFAEMRSEAIAALALPDLYVDRWWRGLPAGSPGLSFTNDFETYARIEADGSVSVRRVAVDTETHHLPSMGPSALARLSPDGRYLLQLQSTAPHRGRLWDLAFRPAAIRAEEIALGPNHRFRTDGRLLALTHRDGAISVYDTATGRPVARLSPDPATTEAWIDLHPTAPLVAVSSYFHQDVVVRDLRSGAVVVRQLLPWSGGGFATWHPGGRVLCVGDGNSVDVRVYDFDPGDTTAGTSPVLNYRRSFPTKTGGGTRVVFNPAGDRVVASGWGGTVSLIDFDTGQTLFDIMAPFSGELQFDRDGGRLGAKVDSARGTVGYWRVGDGREYRTLTRGPAAMGQRGPAVSPDGRLVALTAADGFRLLELASGREVAAVSYGGRPAGCVMFEPSGAVLTNGRYGCFRWPACLDPADSARMRLGPPERLPFHPGDGPIAASRDGRVVAQAMFLGFGMQPYVGGWILHPDRPGEPRRVAAGASMFDAAVSPDGRWAAFAIHDVNIALVFDTATGRQVGEVAARQCLFTADGRWLVTDRDGGRAYAVGTWEPGPRLGVGLPCSASADGRLVILATDEGHFRLAETATGRELARLDDPDQHAGPATITGDATRLVAMARDGVRVWDLRLIRQGLADLGLDWDVPPPSPDVSARPQATVRFVGTILLDPGVRAWWELAGWSVRLLRHPDDAAARRHRGAAARQVGLPRLAEWDYGRALDGRPDDRAARLPRGRIRLQAGRPAEALADFDEMVRRDPADLSACYYRARALIDLGRYAEAAAACDPLVAKYATDTGLLILRGRCRDRAGDTAGGAADLALAQKFGGAPAKAANDLAWQYVIGPETLRNPTAALPLARSAVGQSPGTWAYHNTLGVALYRLGRHSEAIEALSASLEHAKGTAAPWDLYALAMCHHRRGDPARARDCYDRAVRGHRHMWGLTLRETDDLDEFRAEARAVLVLPWWR